MKQMLSKSLELEKQSTWKETQFSKKERKRMFTHKPFRFRKIERPTLFINIKLKSLKAMAIQLSSKEMLLKIKKETSSVQLGRR